MSTLLQDLVRLLAHSRQAVDEYKQEVADIEAEIAASPLGQRLAQVKEHLKAVQSDADHTDENVRQVALDLYGTTGTKAPHPAVKIRVVTKLDYVEEEAVDWCEANLPDALKLDKRLFEKHAKAVAETAPIDIVEITQEPQATVSRDLSEYLTE